MAEAQIAASHYEPDGQGGGRKTLINRYAEPNPQDPARPMALLQRPGSRLVSGLTSPVIRGIAQTDGHAGGKLLVLDGTTLRAMDRSAETFTTIPGTVAGTDRTQWAFGEAEAGLLANGSLYVSTGSAVAAATDADWATLLSDHSQSAFTSIATLGQRLIASYGSRFAFSSALGFNETTTISWYTAETAPDGIVALAVVGTTLYVFGTQTIEPWVQTGNNDDPFSPITGQTISRGCAARDSIVELDNSLFFVADDRTVRRLNELTPQILNASDPWVTRILEKTAPADIICQGIETDAHTFYMIHTPTACIVYDVATGTFHKRETYLSETYDYKFQQRVGAVHYGASAGKLAVLSRDYATDDQTNADTLNTARPIVWNVTAHLPVTQGRTPISRVRLEGAKGVGRTVAPGNDPVVQMRVSTDNGNTWGSWRDRALGKIGEYATRTYWTRCGRGEPPSVIFEFRGSEPVRHDITRIAVNEI